MKAQVQKECKHCGLASGSNSFCCSGCEAAWSLIHEHGLDSFYEHREKISPQIKSSTFDIFEAYEHPDFLDQNTKKRGDERSATFKIGNLYCAACIWLLEKLPKIVPECREARVDFGRGKIFLRWEDRPKNLQKILKTVGKLGYSISFQEDDEDQKVFSKKEWLRLGITAALALPVMHLGLYFISAWRDPMASEFSKGLGWISALLALPVVVYGAAPFFKTSFAALKFRRLHADLLVCVAIVVAYVYSLVQSFQGGIEVYYDSLCLLILLLLAGRMLVRYSSQRLSKPKEIFACRIERQKKVWIPAKSLKTGDRVFVPAAEILPTRLRLNSSEAWIDQSLLTGESIPVRFVEGQELPEAAKNLGHAFEAEVIGREDVLRQIEEADQSVVLDVSHLWEQIFVAFILIFSAGTFLWGGVERTVAILIVACPCALALSRPLVWSALSRQFFRSGLAIFRLDRVMNWPQIKAIAFDKTGTLTKGLAVVTKMHWQKELSQEDKTEALSVLYRMACQSSHPLSRAVALYLAEQNKRDVNLEDFHEILGTGLEAHALDAFWKLSAPANFSEKESLACRFLKKDQELIQFSFYDPVRKEAARVLSELQSMGHPLLLYSGDRRQSVEAFQKKLSIHFDQISSEMKPQDKANAMSSNIAMVGDGLNDAYAMKQSGSSIGMIGSFQSNLESADAYLLKKDLTLIPKLILGTKKARRVIHQNYLISFFYNVLCIVLVLGGWIGPVICAIFMPLSSLSVILMSNLRRYLPNSDGGEVQGHTDS